MKNMLIIVCLLVVGIFIYVDVLLPIHQQREHYQQQLYRYANGISA